MLVIDSQPFPLLDTLRHVYDLLRVKAVEKDLEFNLLVDAGLPEMVMGDKGRLNQIMVSLAGNAIKFTQQGEVTIQVKKVAESEDSVSIKFSVKDTGIGIPAEKIQAIFDRFSKGEENTSRNFGGTGLGLNISKQLIELQQGQLQVKSEKGAGSEFFFTLHYPKMDASLLPKPAEKNMVNIKQNLSILLCEDNVINQRLATNVIEKFGFSVQIANNGEEGIALLLKNHFDLVLMDLQMPIMDGYQASAHIRQELKLSIPIVAMTAHSLIGERQKCFDLGMNAYVPKPFKQEELLAKIEYVMKVEIETIDTSHPSTPSAPQLEVDLSYLKELSEGSAEFEKEIIQLFCKKTNKDIEALDIAMANQTYPAIKEIAHGIRPTLGIFKLEPLTGYLSLLESQADAVLKGTATGLTDEVAQGFELFQQRVEAARQALEEMLVDEYQEV